MARPALPELQKKLSRIEGVLFFILALNLSFWFASRDIYASWQGVPPVPTKRGAISMTLGDTQFSYRFLALTLQNIGNVGRDFTPLKEYNYERLGKWFFLLHDLDPASDHVPMIAAYYFGATRVREDAAHVAKYLEVAGDSPVGEKWRWLAHAAFLAQHRMGDLDYALDLAYRLRKIKPLSGDLPQWARDMPAIILTAKGEKEAAQKILQDMIVSEQNLHPAEVEFMRGYLIDQLSVPPEEVEQLMRMRGGK